MAKKVKKYAEGGTPTSQPNSKYVPSPRWASMGRRELAATKAKGQTTGTMSKELMMEIMSDAAGRKNSSTQPIFALAKKLFDTQNTAGEVKYKKGGKVKKAKCRDGIARKGKTKGTIR